MAEFWNFLIMIGFIVLAGLVFMVWFSYFRKKGRLSAVERQKFLKSWHKIKQLSEGKQKIMEADKLLGLLLKHRGFQGSVGEMMKKAKPLFGDNDGIWRAHRLRNQIAHELHFSPQNKQVGTAVQAYERAFRELGL